MYIQVEAKLMDKFIETNFKLPQVKQTFPNVESISTITNTLDDCICFKRLPLRVRYEIATMFTLESYKTNDCVIENNFCNDKLYIVSIGTLQETEIDDLKVKRVQLKYAKDMVNDICFFCPGIISNKSIIARENSQLWVLHRDTFKNIIIKYQQEISRQLKHINHEVNVEWIFDYYFQSLVHAQNLFEFTSLFKNVCHEDIIKMISLCQWEHKKQNEIIIYQKNVQIYNPKFYIVHTGYVDIFIEGKYIKRISKGDYFGDLSFLDDVISYTVIAHTDVSLFSFNDEAFEYALLPLHNIIFDQKDENEIDSNLSISFSSSTSSNDVQLSESRKVIIHLFDKQEIVTLNTEKENLDLFDQLCHKMDKSNQKPLYIYTQKIIHQDEKEKIYQIKSSFSDDELVLVCIKKSKNKRSKVDQHIFDMNSVSKVVHSTFCNKSFGCFENDKCIYVILQKLECSILAHLDNVNDDFIRFLTAPTRLCGLQCLNNVNLKLNVHKIEKYVVFYAACIVLALEYLHLSGIVFRNVKPENILLDDEGYAYLTNYSFMEYLGSDNRKTSTFVGSPGFMSPEISKSEDYGFEADFWALGATMYYLLMNDNPFNFPPTDSYLELINRSSDIKYKIKFPPFVSDEIKNLIGHLLHVDKAKRLGCVYPNITQNINDVKNNKCFHWIDWKALKEKKYIIGIHPMKLKTFLTRENSKNISL